MPARIFVTLFVLGLLLAPATAFGGGWATVGLSSTPDGLGKGQPWNVNVEVLQHGQTPLAGVQPTITISNASTGASRTVTAHPTAHTGIYRASVVFPSGGTWTYSVNDGFSQEHQFAEVRIAGSPVATTPASTVTSTGDDFPWAALGAALLAGLAAAGLTLAVQRRREDRTAERDAMAAGG